MSWWITKVEAAIRDRSWSAEPPAPIGEARKVSERVERRPPTTALTPVELQVLKLSASSRSNYPNTQDPIERKDEMTTPHRNERSSAWLARAQAPRTRRCPARQPGRLAPPGRRPRAARAGPAGRQGVPRLG